MAPKSAAAVFLLAAMIAGLAPPLQAQLDKKAADRFLSLVDNAACSGDDAMKRCARQLVKSGGATIPLDCCRALLNKILNDRSCACGFGEAAADVLRVDVDKKCQTASNGGSAGVSLKAICLGLAPAEAPPADSGDV
jgi:hypothetical protein